MESRRQTGAAPIGLLGMSTRKELSIPDPPTAGDSAPEPRSPRAIVDVAKLAHELRTPLSAIAVLAEIMRDERLGPLGTERYRGYAADILASAKHANGVLASFVEPAANLGASTLSFAEIDPAEVVAGAVSVLVPLSAQSGVELRAAAQVGLPRIIADRQSLRQMLDNLIANALKFTPPGGVIQVSAGYDVGGPVRIEVIDNGDGMTPSELARARSPEVAVEPLRRRSGGTGLGIPIVRALASASGATLSIDSDIGKGTRVSIAFAYDRVVPV